MKPSVAELYPDLARKWKAQEERERQLVGSITANCVDALEDLAAVLRYPRISLHHIESALAKLTVARDCARVLDE